MWTNLPPPPLRFSGFHEHPRFHLRIRSSGGHGSTGWGRKLQNWVSKTEVLPVFKSWAQGPRDAAPGARTILSVTGVFSTITVLAASSSTHQRPEARIHHLPWRGTQDHLHLHSAHLHTTPADGICRALAGLSPLYVAQITHNSESQPQITELHYYFSPVSLFGFRHVSTETHWDLPELHDL